MGNLDLYNRFAPVPENAKRKITGGKLNGKTDINPMWRIKTLTETFGPVGFGWYTEVKDRWVETGDGESAAWVCLALYVKHPETGEWSKPIIGMGGSKQNGKGQGDGINDEAFKMAETDAISVCCKKLGVGANVYWDADKTKYTGNGDATSTGNGGRKSTKPEIKEGNELWPKAIAYCLESGITADKLRGSYSIDDATLEKLNEAIKARRA